MNRLLPPLLLHYRAAPAAVRAAFLISIATLALSAMQGCVRYVAATGMHPFEVGFFRSLFGFLVFVPILARYGLGPLRSRNVGLHAIRGVLHVTSMLAFFFAITITPLAKAVALDFSGPLFAAVVAIAALGEKLHVRRVAALVVGYAGVLVVVRPGFVALDAGVLWVLLSAATWGLAMVVIKVVAREESSLSITVYMIAFSTPLSLVAAVPFWETPSREQLAWLVVIGALGSIGHLCVAQALREADMTVVVPFDFLRMIWSSIIGYTFFAEVPAIWTWIGSVMIFASAAYVSIREGRGTKEAPR